MILTLLVINLVLWLAAVTGAVWYLRRLHANFQTILLAMLPKDRPDETVAYSLIRERAALGPAESLTFWQSVAASPWWPTLQHKLQQDARGFIHKGSGEAQTGNQHGVAFFSGASWWAMQMAVAPEREIKTAMHLLTQEQLSKNTREATERKVPGRVW